MINNDDPSTTGAAEGDELTRTVAGVWSEVLKSTPLAPDTHFFDHGGHSVAAMRVISRLRREWKVSLPTALIFDNPVLADFVSAVRAEIAAQPAT